jgi:hypothetical protein
MILSGFLGGATAHGRVPGSVEAGTAEGRPATE